MVSNVKRSHLLQALASWDVAAWNFWWKYAVSERIYFKRLGGKIHGKIQNKTRNKDESGLTISNKLYFCLDTKLWIFRSSGFYLWNLQKKQSESHEEQDFRLGIVSIDLLGISVGGTVTVSVPTIFLGCTQYRKIHRFMKSYDHVTFYCFWMLMSDALIYGLYLSLYFNIPFLGKILPQPQPCQMYHQPEVPQLANVRVMLVGQQKAENSVREPSWTKGPKSTWSWKFKKRLRVWTCLKIFLFLENVSALTCWWNLMILRFWVTVFFVLTKSEL